MIQYKHKGRKPKSVVGQGDHEDVGFLMREFLESSSSSFPQVDCAFSSGVVLVELVLSLRWSGLWFALKLGSGLRGKRIKLLFSSLLLMRNIGSGISLRIESSRGLGLGCFVGFSLWVGGEVVASCILRVYKRRYTLFFFL